MRVLFLSRWFPAPLNNGSKLRVFNLLRGLSGQHEVDLLAFADQPEIDLHDPKLRALCADIQAVPWKPFDPGSLQALSGFFDPAPRSVRDTFSSVMAQHIQQATQTKPYDCIVASQVESAAYYRFYRGIPALFDEVEVGVPYEKVTRARTAWQRFRAGLTWAKQRRYLAELLQNFQVCTVVSARERELLRAAVPAHQEIEVIPNCVSVLDYNCVVDSYHSSSLIFTGSFRFQPNYDAMVWFINEVYPRIQAQIPDVRLTITGDEAGKPLPEIPNVVRTGFVQDIRPLIAQSAVSIAPIFQGGGTRLKILEAMALHTPVVATAKGAEGLDVEPNRHLLIADTPEVFADAVIRLLRDLQLRQRLVENAYELVSTQYDWDAVLPRFLKLVQKTAQASAAARN